jgi:hypothetical protein
MEVNVATLIRILKNVGIGLGMAALPLLQPALSNGVKSAEFIGGIVLAVFGLLKDSILKEWVTQNKWSILAKDAVVAICLGAQPLIQNGIGSHLTISSIALAIALGSFSWLANVVNVDVTATTAFGNALKDTCTAGLIALQGSIQVGIANHYTIHFILGGSVLVLATIFSNELRQHLFPAQAPK